MTKTDDREQNSIRLAELREQAESLKLAATVQSLETRLRRAELQDRQIVESYEDSTTWGEIISPYESMMGEEGLFFGTASRDRADARRDGDNAPHFTNEQQLAEIRGSSCFIAETDPAGINIIQTLISYAIGVGMTHTAAAKPASGAAGEAAAAEVTKVIDEFLERVNWVNSLDAEVFGRTRKAGERFVHTKDIGGGYCGVEICEPSWITEPLRPREIEDYYGLPAGLNWKYGVASLPNRPDWVIGYHCCRFGDNADWEFIPAEEMSHVKVNVDRIVKRGLPDFYGGAEEWLKEARKTLRNIVKGAGIQAAIALIRKHSKGASNAQIRTAVDSMVEFQTQLPPLYGSSAPRSVGTERWYSGKIVDERGHDTMYGPMGTPVGPALIGVVDSGLRFAGRRWGFPEDMISGNASANNFASILEAHTPFTIQMKRVQGQESKADTNMLWRVVGIACKSGRIPYSLEQLKQLVTIDVKPPDIETRDQAQDHTVRKEQHEAGLLSLETWSNLEGLDRAAEKKNLADEEWETPPPPTSQPMPLPGDSSPDSRLSPLGSGPTQPAIESEAAYSGRLESLAARALARLADLPTGTQLTESMPGDEDGHWVTIDGEHVLIKGPAVGKYGKATDFNFGANAPLAGRELQAHQRSIEKLRSHANTETMAEFERLPTHHQRDVLNLASARADIDNQISADLRNQYRAVFGEGKRQGAASARAAGIAARGGDETHLANYDDITEKLRDPEYSLLASVVEKRGLVPTLSGGAKQFHDATPGHHLGRAIDEYRAASR